MKTRAPGIPDARASHEMLRPRDQYDGLMTIGGGGGLSDGGIGKKICTDVTPTSEFTNAATEFVYVPGMDPAV
jgi:hypothetical protein